MTGLQHVQRIAVLVLLVGAATFAYAQDQNPGVVQPVPVLHTTVMLPSSDTSGSSQPAQPLLSQTEANSNSGPVNTGSGIVYTCASNVAAATCNYLNTTVAGYYNDTFINANANIYIQYGSTGLGASEQYLAGISYSQYVSALNAIPSPSAIQVSAQSALSKYDAAPYGSSTVVITDALAASFGFTGMTGITAAAGSCSLGASGCYNGLVTVTNSPSITLYYDNLGGSEPAGAYDFYAVVEHETDEVLGTSSCISTQSSKLSDFCGTGTPAAVDLFRYSGAGDLILDSSLSTSPGAYFSYDGGTTNGAKGIGGSAKFYNTLANGEDYADYVASSPCSANQAIQDATGCPGADGGLTILNDGGSEINILTAIGYQVPSSASACKSPNPNPNSNPAVFAAPDDFNGDCKSDILWRNSTTGEAYLWLMNGTTIASQGSLGFVNSGWVIQGVGDFDGNGKSDILWRNSTTGQVYLWLMNGTTIASQGSVGFLSSNWAIQAIGDFSGDGKSDILLRNSTTGEAYLWLMNGTTIASQGSLGFVSSDWVIQKAGDFNGDGKSDILWRNSATGEVDLWLMNGTTIASQGSVDFVSSDWLIQETGDFNGDGKSDILWRNSTTGEIYLWLMNGTTIASQGSVGFVSSDWVIQKAGDFDGDGKSDILWRNNSAGEIYLWLMNGTTIANQGSLGFVAGVWQSYE